MIYYSKTGGHNPCLRIRKDVDGMNRFDRDRFDQFGKEALSRVEELMNTSKINELLHKRGRRREKEKLYSLGFSHHRSRSSGSWYCIRSIPFLYS